MSSEQTMRVRDAMIAEPRSLVASATAREAGEVLTPPEVRAVYVVGDDGELLGVLTRKTLVARVIAEGRDRTSPSSESWQSRRTTRSTRTPRSTRRSASSRSRTQSGFP